MKMFSLMQVCFVLLISSPVLAMSGWSSGGGELLKDARNPWFLNNTKTVSYCIVISDNFGVPRSSIKKFITDGLEFWKGEFKKVTTPTFSNMGRLEIASQYFIENPCGKNTDITFQFGVLSPAQKKYLKDPSEYAAITVRTQYSQKELRGKGFVYVSPSTGPLAYNPSGVVPNAWKKNDGQLLYLTLLHELGHVFGIPHMGSRLAGLMAEDYVESILSSAKKFDPSPKNPLFFSLPRIFPNACVEGELLKVWADFFELDESERCLKFEFAHNGNSELFGTSIMSVSASNEKHGPTHLVAEVELNMKRFTPAFVSLIWLTEEQTVIPKKEIQDFGVPSILGISLISLSKNGSFITKKRNLKRSVSVRFEQGKQTFTIDGIDSQGDIITIL